MSKLLSMIFNQFEMHKCKTLPHIKYVLSEGGATEQSIAGKGGKGYGAG